MFVMWLFWTIPATSTIPSRWTNQNQSIKIIFDSLLVWDHIWVYWGSSRRSWMEDYLCWFCRVRGVWPGSWYSLCWTCTWGTSHVCVPGKGSWKYFIIININIISGQPSQPWEDTWSRSCGSDSGVVNMQLQISRVHQVTDHSSECWLIKLVRIGYYVSNDYTDPELKENNPSPPQLEKLQRNILATNPRWEIWTITAQFGDFAMLCWPIIA